MMILTERQSSRIYKFSGGENPKICYYAKMEFSRFCAILLKKISSRPRFKDIKPQRWHIVHFTANFWRGIIDPT